MRIGPLLVLVLILYSAGCLFHRPAPEHTVNITDDLGNTVMVPVPVRRIVSLAPSETEIVGALGRTDLLVGRCSICTWPPDALRVPVVGGYQTFSVNGVADLDPDLVLATPHVNETRLQALRDRGYPVLVFGPETFEEVFGNIRGVGDAIGEQENASRVVMDLQVQELDLKGRIQGFPPVRAIYVLYDQPLYAAGNQTYENSLITEAGGINPIAAWDGYLQTTPEIILWANPDVILVPSDAPGVSSTLAERIAANPALAGVPAVKNHRICAVDPQIAHWPSPRMVQGLALFSQCLHAGG